MLVLITSCGRFDLLQKTIDSFLNNPFTRKHINWIVINEDSLNGNRPLNDEHDTVSKVWVHTGGIGQHQSIEHFIKYHPHEVSPKYYLHLEDDFEFTNHDFDWIQASIDIMEHDPSIIKVLARKDSIHPCNHELEVNGIKYGILDSWENNGIEWKGFSWNCGVTRLDYLENFIPFRKWEQDVALAVALAGFKVAELAEKVYHHIGDGRSTHV